MDSAAEDSPVPGDATAVQRALAVLRVHAPAFFQQLAHLPVAGEGPSDPSLDAAAQAPDRSCLRTPDEAKPRLLSHVSTDEVEASPIGDNEQQQQHHHHSAEGQPRRTHRHRSRGTDGAEVGQRQRSGRRRKSVGSAVSDVPSGVAECPEPLDAKLLHDSTGELPQEDDHVIKTPASDDHGPRSGRPKRALFTIHCATLNLHTTFQTAAGPIAPSSNPGTLSGTAGLPVSLAEALATFHTVAGLAGASGVAHHPSPGAIDVAAAVDSITENPEGAAPKPVKVPITSICQPPLPPVPAAPQPAYVPAALPAATYDASRGMAAPMAAERDAGTPHPATHTPGIHSRRSSASDLFLAPGLSAPRQPPLGAVPRQDSPALSPGPSVQSTPSRATREPPRCRIPLPSSQGTEAGPTSDHTRAVGRTFLLDSLPAVKDSPRGRGMEDHAPHEASLLPWRATPPPWSAADATVTALCPSYRALWEAAHQPSVCRTKHRPPPRSPSNSSMSTFSRSHPADSDSEEIDRLLQLQATEGPSATSAWLRSGAAAGRKRDGGSTAASTDRPEWPLGVWSLGQRATVGAGGLTI